jgi:CRISPR/Cas system-associated exonuclease Cas4 (RecB family)
VQVIWTLEDWARAIIELPCAGEVPDRTVFVPNERVAHALRRALIELGAPSALVGTRFLTLVQLAREQLTAAGELASIDERGLGPALVQHTFGDLAFERFRRDDLLELAGWDEAFARTIGELDGALLDPAAMSGDQDAHVRDVARVYAALRQGGELATIGLLLQRAAAVVQPEEARGSKLALVTGFESLAEARLLRSLPGVHWGLWGVRPLRSHHLQRMAQLWGQEFADALRASRTLAGGVSALRQLQAGLFGEQCAGVAADDDGSVRIALYAGVHEEVEAAVGWVVEQLVEQGLAAHELAILSPSAEPYAALLRARLGVLPWADEAAPLFCERGVPLTERSDGSRLWLALTALRQGLSRESLAALLPCLRATDPERRVRGRSQAWEILNVVAAVGGGRGALEAGRLWLPAWHSALARHTLAPLHEEEREQQRRSDLAAELAAWLPAIAELTALLARMLAGAPLHEWWALFAAFARQHLRLPPEQPPSLVLLEPGVAQFARREQLEPAGVDAVEWLCALAARACAPAGRYGLPAIYIGTLAGAQGMAFRSVRILGLVEGSVPSASREDPVLPDALRTRLSPLLPTSRQRAHRQLVAFDFAVRAARERLALSAPRVSLEGSARQPASVLLDVVRALAGASTQQDLGRQLEAAASAGRAHERTLRSRLALGPGARLERLARGAIGLEGASLALDLARMRELRERTAVSAQDGFLPGILPAELIAGLHADHPISASRLQTLLACPHRYLLEQLLYFRDASRPLESDGLNKMAFGTWLHAIAESFWREHGTRVAERAGELTQHRAALRALAIEQFRELASTYPFANPQIAQAQLEALCDQLDKLLCFDWNEGEPKQFVAVEQTFGYESECRLDTEAGPLYVRGKIDKLDREGGTLLVRDIKTGKAKPRDAKAPPDSGIDLQLGLYALVAKRLAKEWGTPQRVGVSYLYLRRGEVARSWLGSDYEVLEEATRGWLVTAREILTQGAFVRTPNRDDCTYCSHRPVCASELDRVPSAFADERVPERLVQLKQGKTT